ncbi:MAG TPA: methyltransferase domain-containing protein [Pseudomonadales bacterium]|nr:methyltransferase domain-containing protein [Pseudomonadales bacterium]
MQPDHALADIRSWFETPLGTQVVGVQQAVLDQLLPGFFGYHLLQLSVQDSPLHGASPIHHKMSLGLTPDDASSFRGKPTELPFEDDSMDVVLLHHLLEFCDSPQQILREVSRVTIPMGHVVIAGFNPLSLWGLCKPVGRLRGHAPWFGRFIRPGRLMDWLNLLNFKIDRAHYSTYGLPLNRKPFVGKVPDYGQGLSRKSNFPFGATYVIVARKHVGTMTSIKPVWRRQSRAFGRLTVVSRTAGRGVTRTRPPKATD